MKVLLVTGLVALLAFTLVLAIGPPAMAGTQAVPVVVAKVAPLGAWVYSSIEEGGALVSPSDSLLALAIFWYGPAEHLLVEISTSHGGHLDCFWAAGWATIAQKVEVSAPGASPRALVASAVDSQLAFAYERRVMARALA